LEHRSIADCKAELDLPGRGERVEGRGSTPFAKHSTLLSKTQKQLKGVAFKVPFVTVTEGRLLLTTGVVLSPLSAAP